MATTAQIQANRANAKKSTGPRTVTGKCASSRNAIKHGLFSKHLFVDADEQEAFQALWEDLKVHYKPVGPIEEYFVERIAVAMWRQRRLNIAEGAMTRLNASAESIARQKRQSPPYGSDDLIDFFCMSDEAQGQGYSDANARWAEQAQKEITNIREYSVPGIMECAPTTYKYIQSRALGRGQEVEEYISDYEGGYRQLFQDIGAFCEEILQFADERRADEQLSAELKKKALLLPQRDLELISRYQTTLDNQLFKALKALHDQQALRMKTLDLEAVVVEGEG